jgi:putative ABC transport system permease protein
MTIVGGMIGIGFVMLFNILLSEQITISKPSISLYLTAFSVIFASSTIATWWPARQTSKIPPVIATRTV